MEMFTIGYYICEYSKCPEYLGLDTQTFISVSDCLCDHVPYVTKTHGWKPDGDKPEYLAKLGLDRDSYLYYSKEVNKLFNDNKLFMDGRFLYFGDAKYFYEKYFAIGKYALVRARADKFYKSLLEEHIPLPEYDECSEKFENIGCDIIGWDMSFFHSFLCNGLHDLFKGLQFTKYGTADVIYSEAENMADKVIENGRGEPVEWLPVAVEIFIV